MPSVDIKAYQTLFIKPDANNKIIDVNRKTAYACVFKPLNDTLEEFRILFKFSGTASLVTYKVGIVPVNEDDAEENPGQPQLTDLTQLKNALGYQEVARLADNSTERVWLTFKYRTPLDLDMGKKYAIVIYSDLAEGSATDQNGVYFTEAPWYDDTLSGSYIFVNNKWVPIQNNGSEIVPNIFMWGKEIDEDNAIDAGITQTAGSLSTRGYEIYLTLKNVGDLVANSVTLDAVEDTENIPEDADEETYRAETFLAPGQWNRFDPEKLPLTASRFVSELKSSATGVRIRPDEIVLYVQHDRMYPHPKPFVKIDSSPDVLNTEVVLTGSDDVSDSLVGPYNSAIYYKGSDANIVVSEASLYQFKTFRIINRNAYKDKAGQPLSTKQQSVINGKYIIRFADNPPQWGYQITEHNTPTEVKVSTRRVYPTSQNINSLDEIDNAYIQAVDTASVYSGVWKAMGLNHPSCPTPVPFNLNSKGRFVDGSSTEVDHKYSFMRMFCLNLDDSSQLISEGDSLTNKLTAPDNQLPYFIVNNVLNPTTRTGNNIQSIGFSIFSGKGLSTSASTLTPASSDAEILNKAGLTDLSNSFGSLTPTATGQSNYAKGMLLVQHMVDRDTAHEYIHPYLIRKINATGIITDGLVVCVGYVTVPYGAGATFTNIKLQTNQDLTNMQYVEALGDLCLLLNPFGNPNFGSSNDTTNELGYLAFDGDNQAIDTTDWATATFNMFSSHNYSDFGMEAPTTSGKTNIYPAYLVYRNSTIADSQDEITQTGNKVTLLFDTSMHANGEYDPTTSFYNTHNLTQINSFIDSLEGASQVRVCTLGTAGNTTYGEFSSDADTIKSQVQALFDDVINGTATSASMSDDYRAGVRSALDDAYYPMFTTTADGYGGIIYLFANGSRNDNLYVTVSSYITAQMLYDRRVLVCPIQIYPAYKTVTEFNVEGLVTKFTVDTFSAFTIMNAVIREAVVNRSGAVPVYINALDTYYDSTPTAGKFKGYYTYTTNGNLSQLMLNDYNNLGKLYFLGSQLIPGITDYSIVLPFIADQEVEPITATSITGEYTVDSSNKFFTGTNQIFDASLSLVKEPTESTFKDGVKSMYEVFEDPIDDWGDSNSVYNIYTLHHEPVYPENINKDNVSYTVFEFYDSEIGSDAFSDKKSLVLDLSKVFLENSTIILPTGESLRVEGSNFVYGYGYSPVNGYGYGYEYTAGSSDYFDVFNFAPPTDIFNRISFAYKISKPLTATPTSSTAVNLRIEVSDTKEFYRENPNTQVLFDGVVNIDPTAYSLTTFSDNALKIMGHALPDGFNLFILDLKHSMSSDKAKFLRIYADKAQTSVAQDLKVNKLRVYYEDEKTTSLSSLFGTTDSPELAIQEAGTIFSQNNDYFVAELGKEKQIRRITFTLDYSADSAGIQADDELIISYKSFNSTSATSENIIQTINLKQQIQQDTNSIDIEINTCFYARMITFKKEGFGTFKIKNLSLGFGSIGKFYTDPYSTKLAFNYEYAFYDEDIRSAPNSRLAVFNSSPSRCIVGIKLDNNSAVSVTQISFSCITNGNTVFKLQKRTDALFNVSPDDFGWTDIGQFKARDYDRIDNLTLSSENIQLDGTIIALPSDARFSNNKLANYMFRPDTAEEVILQVLESWTDSSKSYIKVNADLRNLKIKTGTKFYLERPTVFSFPATKATALQLVQLSGNGTKVNGLKAYTNLVKSDGSAGTPTTVPELLQWNLQVSIV